MIRQVLLAVFFIGKFFCNMYASVSTYTRYGSGDNYKYEQFCIQETSMKNSPNYCGTIPYSLHIYPCTLIEFIFNHLKTKRILLYLKTQFVPRSKHFSSRL